MERSSVSTGVSSASSPARLQLPENFSLSFPPLFLLHSISSCQKFNFRSAVVSEREPLAGSTGPTSCISPHCSLFVVSPHLHSQSLQWNEVYSASQRARRKVPCIPTILCIPMILIKCTVHPNDPCLPQISHTHLFLLLCF